MEQRVLKALNFDLHGNTSTFRFAERFIDVAQYKDRQKVAAVHYMCELAQVDHNLVSEKPSKLACAAINLC